MNNINNSDIPAFSNPAFRDRYEFQAEDLSHYKTDGLSKLEYFAAHAPPLPEWFTVSVHSFQIVESGKYVSSDGARIYNTYDEAYNGEKGNDFMSLFDYKTMMHNREYEIRRYSEWPWFWANQVLKSKPAI